MGQAEPRTHRDRVAVMGRPWGHLLGHDDEGDLGGKGRTTGHSGPGKPGPWEVFEEGWRRWHASRGWFHGYWGAVGSLGGTEGQWLLGLGEGSVANTESGQGSSRCGLRAGQLRPRRP